jgi:hypothetical protein
MASPADACTADDCTRSLTFDSETGRALTYCCECMLDLYELSRRREGGEGEAVDGSRGGVRQPRRFPPVFEPAAS